MNNERQVHDSPFNDWALRDLKGSLPRNVTINDCTLREAQQWPGIEFGVEDKIRFGRVLAEAGVPQIQVGYPGRSPADCQVATVLAAETPLQIESVILAYYPDWKTDLKTSRTSGCQILNVVLATSDYRLNYVLDITRDDLLAQVAAVVSACADTNAVVAFTAADGTRTDFSFLMDVLGTAEAHGATRLYVADTVGAAIPGGVRSLFQAIARETSARLGAHFHNDLGLALANCLTAVEAGATIVDVTLDGIGDRSGNPSLDEVSVVLELLYDVSTGIDLKQLVPIADMYREFTGVPPGPTKPLTGLTSFSYKLDSHVDAVMKHSSVFEPISPTLIGAKRQIVIGAYSGTRALEYKLKELQIPYHADQLGLMLEKTVTMAQRLGRALTDTELREILGGALPDPRGGNP
ncbi:MAG: LeuA family protein [Ardenticatenaceae bacterium]|nr:LeuA family protein [Ardenticatenaceae bacterium]